MTCNIRDICEIGGSHGGDYKVFWGASLCRSLLTCCPEEREAEGFSQKFYQTTQGHISEDYILPKILPDYTGSHLRRLSSSFKNSNSTVNNKLV
jgi:hypothetical protein